MCAGSEPVFEIRDFTSASAFERLTHRVTVALRRWGMELAKHSGGQAVGEILERTDAFDFDDELGCELCCRYAALQTSVPEGACMDSGHRMPAFSLPGAHRLERWFGTRHVAVLSFAPSSRQGGGAGNGTSVDLDVARTALSALVLAASSRRAALASAVPDESLACFAVIEGGRWQRLIGERCLSAGCHRALYATDRAGFVSEQFSRSGGVAAVAKVFRSKFFLGPMERVNVAVRDTFTGTALKNLSPAPPIRESGEAAREHPQIGDTALDPVSTIQLVGQGTDDASLNDARLQWHLRVSAAVHVCDPVASLAPVVSAPTAPSSMVEAVPPRCRLADRLRRLLGFQADAAAVRSVDRWTALSDEGAADDVTSSIAVGGSMGGVTSTQKEDHLQLFASDIFSYPILPNASQNDADSAPSTVRYHAAPRHSMLARFAEVASKLPNFRAVLVLWALVLGQLRLQLETACAQSAAFHHAANTKLEASVKAGATCPRDATSRKTSRRSLSRRGERAERVDVSQCGLQQRLELLDECFVRLRETKLPRSTQTSMVCGATGSPIVGPPLVLPRLVTEDMEIEWELAFAAMRDPEERLGFASAEFAADASAFKSANPGAELQDFLAWRRAEGLPDSEDEEQADGHDAAAAVRKLPNGWRSLVWERAPPMPAVEQSSLFDPLLEAEKVLHSLESADGMQFLCQLFRICLGTGLDALFPLGEEPVEVLGMAGGQGATCATLPSSIYRFETLRHLRTQASDAALALPPSSFFGTEVVAPWEAPVKRNELFECAVSTCQQLEFAVRFAVSLRHKLDCLGLLSLPHDGRATGKGPLEELVAAAVADPQWRELECPLGLLTDPIVSATLMSPVREYLLTVARDGSNGCSSGTATERQFDDVAQLGGRLYLEVGSGHVRLATTHISAIA